MFDLPSIFQSEERRRQRIFNELPAPNCQLAEGLYLLLEAGEKGVTRRHAMLSAWIMNYPSIIHKLRRRGCVIDIEAIKAINKFGRPVVYWKYVARKTEFKRLVETYQQIVKENA